MKIIAQKIVDILSNYGIDFEVDEIFEIHNDAQNHIVYKTEKKRYLNAFLNRIDGMLEKKPIENFNKLIEKMKLESEWAGLPDWFTIEYRIEYDVFHECFSLSRLMMSLDFTLVYANELDLTFFEQRSGETYKLKKMFHPEEAESIAVKKARESYFELEKKSERNEALKEMTEEIKELVQKLFEESLRLSIKNG